MPVLEPMWAAIAAIAVVVGILVVWKLFKFALKIAVIVGLAILVWLALDYFGIL